MRKALIIGTALFAATLVAQAQQAPAGSAVVSSQPGRVAAAQVVKASAVVTAVDPATRVLSLKTADGATHDMKASAEVRNFEQIKVNDTVTVAYMRGLTMELRKAGSTRQGTESSDAARSKPGEKPGGVVASRVTVVADVIDVNPTAKTISLRGPKGNVVVLDVQNPDQFKVVKKGDQVEAEYVEAVAIAVEAAPKK